MEHLNILFDGTINGLNYALSSVASVDNNTYYLSEMVKQPDKSIFVEEMVKEVKDQSSRRH